MDYIPTRLQPGNQVYGLAAMLAHNLSREMQMQARPRENAIPRSGARRCGNLNSSAHCGVN
jgi:hypothetical protein